MWKFVSRVLTAVAVTVPIIAGTILDWKIPDSKVGTFVITAYGLLNVSHFALQMGFAFLNRRKMNKIISVPHGGSILPRKKKVRIANRSDTSTETGLRSPHEVNSVELRAIEEQPEGHVPNRDYALQIVGYREDPLLFEECLKYAMNLSQYDKHCVKIFICIDGNDEDDMYMRGIAERVFLRQPYGLSNYTNINLDTTLYDSDLFQRNITADRGRSYKIVCITQPHRGKRYAMYTPMWLAIHYEIKYLLFTDSDTWLDRDCPRHLLDVFHHEKFTDVGAVTGDVRIYNVQSYLTLLVNQKYWTAFNLERASQSYFGCVSCISGPLGMYDTACLDQVIEDWITQKFCCKETTFGDDRHLTNLILSLGKRVYYNHLAVCYTETPVSMTRWFTQQTRWGRSFIREYLINWKWFHKAHIWLVYDLTYLMFYPYFLLYVMISIFVHISLSSLIVILVVIIGMSTIRSLFAICLTKDSQYLQFSLFGIWYTLLLLPLKVWSLLTIRTSSWGTSPRLKIVNTFVDSVPIIGWVSFLCYFIVNASLHKHSIGHGSLLICAYSISCMCMLNLLHYVYLVMVRKIFNSQSLLSFDLKMKI